MGEGDLERENRDKLHRLLEGFFDVWQEVRVSHPVFKAPLRADLLARLRGSEPSRWFAFEVKAPTSSWEFKHWSAAIKQASDYVLSSVTDERIQSDQRRIVDASFVFPTPNFNGEIGPRLWIREWDKEPLRGAFNLATHLRVGWVDARNYPKRPFSLKFGPKPIWDSNSGLRHSALASLESVRLGSGRIKTYP